MRRLRVLQARCAAQTIRTGAIGLSDGDCAPPPSHTTGHAVFRIRRLNQRAFYLTARSPVNRKPYRRSATLLSAVFKTGCFDTAYAPRLLCTMRRSRLPVIPSCRNRRNRPLGSCHRNQKHFRMCRRTQPSSSRAGARASASRKYPHQPRTYWFQSSRSWLLVRLRLAFHSSRTRSLNRAILSGATPIRFLRSSRKPRNLGSQTLPVPLLEAVTFSRRCFSIQSCIEASVRSAA
jgi:hypothetical protein